MKQLLSYLFALLALVTLALAIYKAIPVAPYFTSDPEVFIFAGMFIIFYYLAYKTSNSKKDKELT